MSQYLLFIVHILKRSISGHLKAGSLSFLGKLHVQWSEVGTLPLAKGWWYFKLQGGNM